MTVRAGPGVAAVGTTVTVRVVAGGLEDVDPSTVQVWLRKDGAEVPPGPGTYSRAKDGNGIEIPARVVTFDPTNARRYRGLELELDLSPDLDVGVYDVEVKAGDVIALDPAEADPSSYPVGARWYGTNGGLVVERAVNVLKMELIGVEEGFLDDPSVDDNPDAFGRVLDAPPIAPASHIAQILETRKGYDGLPAGGQTETWTDTVRNIVDLAPRPDYIDWIDSHTRSLLRLTPSEDARVDYADSDGTRGIDLPDDLVLDPQIGDQFSLQIYYDLADPDDIPLTFTVSETSIDSEKFEYWTLSTHTVTLPKATPSDDYYPTVPNLFKVKIRVTDVTMDADSFDLDVESIRNGETLDTHSITLTRTTGDTFESSILVGFSGDLPPDAETTFSDYTFVSSSEWVLCHPMRGYKMFLRNQPVKFYTPHLSETGPENQGHEASPGGWADYQYNVNPGALAELFPGPLVCPTGFPVFSDKADKEYSKLAATKGVLFFVPVYRGHPTTLIALAASGGKLEQISDLAFDWKPASAPLSIQVTQIGTDKLRGHVAISAPGGTLNDRGYDVVRISFGRGSGRTVEEEFGAFNVILFKRAFRNYQIRGIRVVDSDGDSESWDMTGQERHWAKVNEMLSPFGFSVGVPTTANELVVDVRDARWSSAAYDEMRQLDWGVYDGMTKTKPADKVHSESSDLLKQLCNAVDAVARDACVDKARTALLVSLKRIGDPNVVAFAYRGHVYLPHSTLGVRGYKELTTVAHEILHERAGLYDKPLAPSDGGRRLYYRLIMHGYHSGSGPLTTPEEWSRAQLHAPLW